MTQLIALNKPYGVLSQFTGGSAEAGHRTLSEFVDVPHVYPTGRLDRDSEGLLLLTDDGALQARIANPRFKTPKTYLVQVEGDPDTASLAELRRGVRLKDGITRPAEVERIDAPDLWPRSAGALPQERSGLLAFDDDHRRPEPPGATHDGSGRSSDAQAGPLEHRRLDNRRPAAGRVAARDRPARLFSVTVAPQRSFRSSVVDEVPFKPEARSCLERPFSTTGQSEPGAAP